MDSNIPGSHIMMIAEGAYCLGCRLLIKPIIFRAGGKEHKVCQDCLLGDAILAKRVIGDFEEVDDVVNGEGRIEDEQGGVEVLGDEISTAIVLAKQTPPEGDTDGWWA